MKKMMMLSITVSLDEKKLTRDIRSRLGDVPPLLRRHVPIARQMLRKLLDGHILCEPIEEEGKPGYCFTATETSISYLRG